MADGYPSDLLAFAVPSADKNRAGIKDPNMNAPVEPAPKKGQPKKSKPPMLQPPKKPTPLESIKNQGKASGVKFGKKPLWMPDADETESDDGQQEVQPPDNGFDPFTVDPQLVPDAVVESSARPLPPRSPAVTAACYGSPPDISGPGEYLRRKSRLTMELQDGQFSLPVTDIRKSKYSVLVMVPLSEDASIFVPKLGSKLTLTFKDTTVDVYYPGSYVEVDELKTGFMTFIIDESK